MALTERLQFLLTLNGDQAVRALRQVGDTADKELGKAETSGQKLSAGFVKYGASAVAFAGVAGAALFSLAKSGSDLGETISASQVIFGKSSKTIEEFGETAAKAAGLSKTAAIDAANSFGTFGKSAKLTGGDLANFSTDMVQLAGDFASFKNTSPEEAVLAIGAALRGESEPIRRYGILLDDAALKARALQLGIYDGTGALTAQQKVLAAQAEILAQSSDAQGDFERTSDSLANQQRILAAEFENLKAKIGTKLIPVFQQMIGWLVSAAGYMEGFGKTIQLAEDDLDHFTGRIGRGFHRIGDALNPFNDAADHMVAKVDLIDTATERMATGFGGVDFAAMESGFKGITEASEGAATGFGGLDYVTDELATGFGDIDFVKMESGFKGITEAEKRLRREHEAYNDALSSSDWGAASLDGAVTAMGAFTDQQNSLTNLLQEQTKAWDGYSASVKDGGFNLDVTTEKGAAQQDALEDLAGTIDLQLASAYKDAAGNGDVFAGSADNIARTLKSKLQKELHLSDDQIHKVLESLGLLPEQVETRYRMAGDEEARIKIGLLQTAIDNLPKDVQAKVTQSVLAGDYVGAVNTIQRYNDNHPTSVETNAEAGDTSGARSVIQSWFTRNPVSVRVKAVPFSDLFAKGGTVGPDGGIGGEAGPELIELNGKSALIDSPTALPPGTEVTPLESSRGRSVSSVRRGGGGGGTSRSGGPMYITINMQPGSDGRDVVEAIKKYERFNGPGWRS